MCKKCRFYEIMGPLEKWQKPYIIRYFPQSFFVNFKHYTYCLIGMNVSSGISGWQNFLNFTSLHFMNHDTNC